MACFTACTNEDAIDGPVIADGTINVSFSIDGILTKAINEPGSPAEYTVNKSTVALFDYVNGVPTNCIGFSGADPTKDGNNLYTVSGIDVKSIIGKPVYVLVLANSDNTYTKEMTYQQYLADIVKTESFDPSSLVKVGGKQHTFTKDASSRTVKVELTQLPARVDVKFAFPNEASGHNCTFEVTSYKVEKVNRWSNSVLPEYTSSGYTYNKASEEVDLSWTKEEGASGISTFSFYTYEKATASNPVVMTITGELFDGSVTETKTYTLNLNPTTTNGGETNGLIHGHLYDVTGNIDISTKQVTFDVKAKEWEEVNVDANIKDVHYLFVKEHLAYMSNVDYYEIDFAADLTVSKEGAISATYEDYYLDRNNTIQKRISNCTGAQIPDIVVDNENKLLKITSVIPKNYFPKTITFSVTNGQGLSETVKIIQYPPQYLEGEVSAAGHTESYANGDKQNLNLFTITTIVSDKYKTGDPRDGNGLTKEDEESNELVSPKFVVASRRAVVTSDHWTRGAAVGRCQRYWETTDASKTGANATYPPGTWRLPTLAELEFMSSIQQSSPSVKYLFNDDSYYSQYWSGRKSWYYNFYNKVRGDAGSDNVTISGGGVRCVRDVY